MIGTIIGLVLGLLLVGSFANRVVKQRRYGITPRQWWALSEASRKVLEKNRSLPPDWRRDNYTLYNTLVGLDTFYTKKKVHDKYYESYYDGGSYFQWDAGKWTMPEYYHLYDSLNSLAIEIASHYDLSREQAHAYAKEDADSLLESIHRDRSLVSDVSKKIKELE